MEPSHIPEINRYKAVLVRAELLIQAHQRWLVQYVKQLYNMDFIHSCLYFTVSEPQCVNTSTTYCNVNDYLLVMKTLCIHLYRRDG